MRSRKARLRQKSKRTLKTRRRRQPGGNISVSNLLWRTPHRIRKSFYKHSSNPKRHQKYVNNQTLKEQWKQAARKIAPAATRRDYLYDFKKHETDPYYINQVDTALGDKAPIPETYGTTGSVLADIERDIGPVII